MASDLLLGTLALCATLPAVAHSYWAGGDVCARKHGIRVTIGSRARLLPGWLGDLMVFAVLLLALALADGLLPGYEITASPPFPAAFALAYGAILALVLWQARRRIAESLADPEDCIEAEFEAKLRGSYRLYVLHAAMVFTVGFFIALKILGFFVAAYLAFQSDLAAFRAEAEALAATLSRPLTEADAIRLGELKLRHDGLARGIMAQVEPFLFIALLALAANAVILSTPLRYAFRDTALDLAKWTTFALVAVLAGVSVAAFWLEFSALSAAFRDTLAAALALGAGTLEVFAYLADMLSEANTQAGFSGFVRVFAAEGGVIVLVLTALQWVLPRVFPKRDRDAA